MRDLASLLRDVCGTRAVLVDGDETRAHRLGANRTRRCCVG